MFAKPISRLCAPFVAALTFALPGPVPAGPITYDASDPTWLTQDGAPLFFCGAGDPEGFFHRGSENPDGTRNGDQQAIIDAIVGSGANIMWVTGIRSHGGDGNSTENPFLGNNASNGVNPAVLDQWDGWISQLDAAGVITFFTFYDDGTRVWNTGNSVSQAEKDFIAAVVNKFENYDNILWNVCEEYQEAFSQTRVSNLAAEIRLHDDHEHPIGAHQHESWQFHFANDPILDFHAQHAGHDNTPDELHTKVVNAYNYAAGRYHVIMSESVNHYTDRTLARQRSWAAAMGGATVMAHAMIPSSAPNSALEDHGRLAAFFQAIPFFDMEPRDDLAHAATEYVFGSETAGWVLYADNLSGSLGIDLPAAGNFDLYWMDTETGAQDGPTPLSLSSGPHSWATPGGLGDEIVLYLAPSTSTGSGAGLETADWSRVKSLYRTGTRGGSAND